MSTNPMEDVAYKDKVIAAQKAFLNSDEKIIVLVGYGTATSNKYPRYGLSRIQTAQLRKLGPDAFMLMHYYLELWNEAGGKHVNLMDDNMIAIGLGMNAFGSKCKDFAGWIRLVSAARRVLMKAGLLAKERYVIPGTNKAATLIYVAPYIEHVCGTTQSSIITEVIDTKCDVPLV